MPSKAARTAIALLIFLTTLLLPLEAPAQKALRVADIAGRQVTLELVRSEDLSPVSWPNESVTLAIEEVQLKDDTIPKLLEARGIVPDNESYTLFYDLNPDVDTVAQVGPDSKYKFPKIVGWERLDKSLQDNCLVLLTVDQDLKARLKNRSRTLANLAQRFRRLSRARFTNPNRSKSTKRNVRDLASWYDSIDKTVATRTAQPMRRVTLLQIVNEAEALTRLLSRAIRSRHKVRSVDQAQITRIHQDIEAFVARQGEKMAGDLPPAEAQYELEVVIQAKDSSALTNLRVYYVMNGYYSDPPTNPPVKSSSFNRLGPRVSQPLPVHNYRIWVAKDGEPANQLIKAREVYVNRNMTVELSLP